MTNSDPQLRDRLRFADEFPGFEVEKALTAVGRGIEARRRRRRVEAWVLVTAIVGVLGFVFWRASISGSTGMPAGNPTVSVAPFGDRIDITPPPPGTRTQQSIEEVEAYVLAQIAADEEELGGALAPARIISIRFVPAGDGSGLGRYGHDSWVVEYEGTVVVCSSWCSGHPGAVIQFSDEGPDDLPGSSHMYPLVCVKEIVGAAQDFPSLKDEPKCSELVTRTP